MSLASFSRRRLLTAAAAVPLLAAAPAGRLRARTAGDDALYARLNRITWGATPALMDTVRREGFERWLAGQLRPPATPELPDAVRRGIAALSISKKPSGELAQALYQRSVANKDTRDPDEQVRIRREILAAQREPAQQARERAAWLALYSPSQLQDQMTWFWMNHFNVWANKGAVGTLVDEYESQAIRPHALGRFRDLLAASLRAPAMLLYLDNHSSRAGKINENYARELMELHTLGVDGGYSQRDVQELARILTGVSVNLSGKPPRVKAALAEQLRQDGLFLFNPARHDFGDKTLLGKAIPGQGWPEVEQALDLLAAHPATARHISRKLATFFITDQPSETLVQELAEQYQRSKGDIAALLKHLFDSQAFTASLDQGLFKDPVHYVYSALRLALHDQPPITNPAAVVNLLQRLGQPLYGRLTPDGYGLRESDWNGSGQMNARFEVARTIALGAGVFYKEGEQRTPRVALTRLDQAYGADSPFARWPAAVSQAISAARTPDSNLYLLSAPPFMRR
ncbi:DUF1800 domain-containing protein [Bordetella trematum]|uniref:DUF1800 domain-containing protein n=1 Tax=Bordetella trematum TaxID=123899 RepID=UPI001559B0C7|nr:DUF1800 domain-containing protein [Bordetella trematum]